MNKQQPSDTWGNLFRQLPEKELPADFRFNVMQQVMKEAAKQQKRNERIGILLIILASLLMVALAVATLLYIDLPRIRIPPVDPAGLHFYLYIGGLTLLLLWGDHKLRQLFRKDG